MYNQFQSYSLLIMGSLCSKTGTAKKDPVPNFDPNNPKLPSARHLPSDYPRPDIPSPTPRPPNKKLKKKIKQEDLALQHINF
jgi:hypothetical protein